ncbi:type IV toxin-antitoxin system AbiEi family antitoxin domain-containing protein [Hymenobacter sp. 102]|uniref:type IV toxin-antitoxin system AbiEi family antitoxin domain-containing protein n=1 Tax=Hymenobacter sp. 102 TaxID=3403152 RepID=UPI003CEA7279
MEKVTKSTTARQKIINRLQQLEPGALVRYQDFASLDIAPGTVAVNLSRLRQEGVVQQVTKGTYRLPLQSRFGPVPVSEQQVLQVLLQTSSKKLRGYPTGVAAFNRLRLTTQVPQEILIATSRPGRPKKVGNVRVRFVRSRADVQPEEVPLCQLLDALRQIKRLPDTSPAAALLRLREQIKQLPSLEQAALVRLAQDYNPATRALLGALLEGMGEVTLATKLKASLNPLSTYKLGLSEQALPNRAQWHIQ